MYIDLEIVKEHLNIDYNTDDSYIISLIEVAEDAVKQHLCVDDLNINGSGVPASIRHAILLMIGSFYANRESITDSRVYKVPLAYEYLLALYQKY